MGKAWRRAAKNMLGLHLCSGSWSMAAEGTQDEEDEYQSAPEEYYSPPHRAAKVRRGDRSISAARSPFSASSASASASSTPTPCAICLEPMKTGAGQALFTAECSHGFHFACIASNVKHGSSVCPVCRAKWKEVPWQAPSPSPPVSPPAMPLSPSLGPLEPRQPRQPRQPRTTPNSSRALTLIYGDDEDEDEQPEQPEQQQQQPVEDPVIRIIDESIASSYRSSTPTAPSLEPCVYDDDDCLDSSPSASLSPPSSSSSSSFDDDEDGQEHKLKKQVDVQAFAEFPSVLFCRSCTSTVLIHVKAPSSSSSLAGSLGRAPIDLVTVLDVSGSMSGIKLLLLKRAMAFLIRNLSTQDRLSVVAFSSSARRLFPLRIMNEEGRRQALRAIDSVACTGGTNIADGLRKAAKLLGERRYSNPVASVMLLSDGQDTYSTSTTNKAQLLPGSMRTSKVPVHAFGFGADHDAATMHSIAEASGGSFSFIQAEAAVQDAFAQCVGGLLSVLVQDVELSVAVPDEAMKIRNIQAGSYATTLYMNGSSGTISIGDLYADEERDVLVEVQLPAMRDETQSQAILEVRCSYRDPGDGGERQQGRSSLLTIRRTATEKLNDKRSIEVDRQRNRLLAARSIAKATAMADSGDIIGAQAALKDAQERIRSSAAAKNGDKLSRDLEAELDDMIRARIASKQMYERSGRAYILSAQSSHLSQRATMRGYSVADGYSREYRTPSMTAMLQRSHSEDHL